MRPVSQIKIMKYILLYAIVKELDNCAGGCTVTLGPPEGLRPACCLPHHPEPKGSHKQSRWRMWESNQPPRKVS